MSNQKNILVFPAGSEIGLEVFASLKQNKHFRLFAATSTPSHAGALFPEGESFVPFITDPDFEESLNRVISEHSIDYIFPAHDDVIVKLAQNADKYNAQLLCPPWSVCQITQYKAATFDFFAGQNFVPKTYKSREELSDHDQFPVFRKPSRGQNSIGGMAVQSAAELDAIEDPFKDHVICELLPGREYTVDCFSDRHGNLHYAKARQRVRTKYGISMNSRSVTELDEEVGDIAKVITSELGIFGAWFFQIKEDRNGRLKLLEIAPRLAGTSVTARYSGVNLAALTVYDAAGIDIAVIDSGIDFEVERALYSVNPSPMTFEHLYVDLDDTLIQFNGKVNLKVLSLVYIYNEAAIPVTLITRHERDVSATLKENRINEALFTNIVHIQDKAVSKSEFIDKKMSALFIDDAFSERHEVANAREKCIVIDTDAIDGFIDPKRL